MYWRDTYVQAKMKKSKIWRGITTWNWGCNLFVEVKMSGTWWNRYGWAARKRGPHLSPLWLLSWTTLGNEPNSFFSLVPKIQMSYFPPFQACFLPVFLPLICNRSWTYTMGRQHGYICWGRGAKNWALCLRTPEIWFWSISCQGVTEELGAEGQP